MKGSRADRTRKDQGTSNTPKDNPFANQRNWIGGDLPRTTTNTPPPPIASTIPPSSRNEWLEKREDPRPQAQTRLTAGTGQSRGIAVGSKSPVELMQDILKGAREGEEVRSYYSRQTQEALGELLTNKFKLGSYIKRLQGEMVGLDAPVVKNYELLVLLLQQVSNADVEVRQGDAGMEIRFNRGIIQRQEAEIERLQREKEERERQMKYVIDEYESIIFNFNDVIEKLVNREEGRHNKSKF